MVPKMFEPLKFYCIISNTFATYDNFSEQIIKSALLTIVFHLKTNHHEILVPKGPVAKGALTRP